MKISVKQLKSLIRESHDLNMRMRNEYKMRVLLIQQITSITLESDSVLQKNVKEKFRVNESYDDKYSLFTFLIERKRLFDWAKININLLRHKDKSFVISLINKKSDLFNFVTPPDQDIDEAYKKSQKLDSYIFFELKRIQTLENFRIFFEDTINAIKKKIFGAALKDEELEYEELDYIEPDDEIDSEEDDIYNTINPPEIDAAPKKRIRKKYS